MTARSDADATREASLTRLREGGAFVSLDPAHGIDKYAGLSFWTQRRLAACAKIKLPPAGAAHGRGSRGQIMVRAIVAQLQSWGVVPSLNLTAIVHEWPQVYRAARAPGDPNDLLGLVAVGAGVAAQLDLLKTISMYGALNLTEPGPAIDIVDPKPDEWSNGLPKSLKGDPWKSLRGIRVASRLSPAELALVPKSHDAIDSVGIGLWACGRFEPRRVYPGAT